MPLSVGSSQPADALGHDRSSAQGAVADEVGGPVVGFAVGTAIDRLVSVDVVVVLLAAPPADVPASPRV